MLRLEGRNALITGASSGIGQAIAIRFAQEGANVAINFRSDPEQAAATQQMVRDARSAANKPPGTNQQVHRVFEEGGPIAFNGVANQTRSYGTIARPTAVTSLVKSTISRPKSIGRCHCQFTISLPTGSRP